MRVLIVGQDAAGPALHEAVQRLWPDAEVEQADVLMGRGAGPTLRTVGRYRWLTRVVGSWSGRRLAGVIDRARPDLIISTSPLTTSGLEWLRIRRGLPVPTGSWSSSWVQGGEREALEDGLRLLAARPAPRPPRPLRSADALFLHAESAATPQHVGTVVVFDTGPEPSPEQVAAWLAAAPGVAGQLRTGPHGARWVPAEPLSAAELVEVVDAAGRPILGRATDEFFSRPLDPARQLGAARLVTGLPDGRHAVLVKLHHALGDGVAVLQALLAETDGATGRAWSTRPRLPMAADHLPGQPSRVLRGLWRLARAGGAPWTPFNRTLTDPGRHHRLITFPARELRSVARTLGLTPAELIPALFAEGVSRAMHPSPGAWFRLMVPWSVRGTGSARLAGNRTGAVPVDLPVGPMPAATRARLVAAAMRGPAGTGVPEAAHTVVWALGALPAPVRAAAARAMYHGRWFNGIGTVLPGPRREVHWHGARLAAAYPILALAPGTGLAWGTMTWGDSVTMGLTTTADLAPLAARITDEIRRALDHLATEPLT